MKKSYKFTALVLLLASMLSVQAQVITIPAANTQGTGASTSLWRKPLGTNRSYERTAIKYTHAEIGVMGDITSISFYVDSINNPGDAITKVYMKEVIDSTFIASTVASEETAAQLVFDDTVSASAFVKGQWTTITLATAFQHYTTNNIEIIIETNSGGTAGTDAVAVGKGFRYSATTGNREQYWQSLTGSGTPPTGNGTLSTNRHNIQLNIIAVPPCTAPPTPGTAISTPASVCASQSVLLTLSGSSIGTGMTYQWISSADSVTWTPIAGATFSSYSVVINDTAYFACILTCSAQSDTSAVAAVYLNPFYNCYCTNLGGSCTAAIDSVAFTSTTLANGPTGCATNFYTVYPASGSSTASLSQGQTYQLVTEYNGNSKSSLWIDYDHNGVFDTYEWMQVTLSSTAGTPVTTNITIPFTAMTGLTAMRIRSRSNTGQNDSTNACTTFGSGETEDYLITITAASACTAPPTAGTASSNPDTICSGTSVNITLAGYTSGTGTTFQWIASTDSVSWTTLAGETSALLSDTPGMSTWYACIVTCSAQSDTSSPAYVYVKPFYTCYCVTNLGGSCTSSIDSVAFTSTTLANGPSGCASPFYTSYPASGSTTANLTQGQTYQLVTAYTGNAKASLWIDYDHNGAFDTYEWTQVTLTATAGTPVMTNVSIPFSAMTGLTGMRIRSRLNTGGNDSTSACANFGSGEVEDYLVTIVAASPCTAPPTAGAADASPDTICAGANSAISLSGYTSGTGTTFQWVSSTDGGATWTAIGGATNTTFTATPSVDTWYAAIVTCSGQSDTSAAAAVTVKPFYNCYCTNVGGGCVTQPGTTIDSVAIQWTTLANGLTGCAPTFYTMYPASGNTTATLAIGQTYTVNVLLQGNAKSVMWIDYNQNGVFEASEGVQVSLTSTAGVVNSVSFTIPAGALSGLTGMRVRSRSTAGTLDTTSACLNAGTGETEDYLVTLSTVSGVKENMKAEQLYVFPNPANSQINVALNVAELTRVNWQIINVNGEVVYNESVSSASGTVTKTMNLSHLPKGIYFVRVITNKQILAKKVVLQ